MTTTARVQSIGQYVQLAGIGAFISGAILSIASLRDRDLLHRGGRGVLCGAENARGVGN
jgi:hypothetical protein